MFLFMSQGNLVNTIMLKKYTKSKLIFDSEWYPEYTLQTNFVAPI